MASSDSPATFNLSLIFILYKESWKKKDRISGRKSSEKQQRHSLRSIRTYVVVLVPLRLGPLLIQYSRLAHGKKQLT